MRAPRTAVVVLALFLTACVPLEAPVPAETTSPESAAQLGQLTVASAGSMRGYSRDRFLRLRR